jgi:hypothetical protein
MMDNVMGVYTFSRVHPLLTDFSQNRTQIFL